MTCTCKSAHLCSTHSVGRHSKVLQVLQEADVRRDAGQVVVAEVQVTQLPAEEELGRNLLDLVPVQVEALQVGEGADLDGDVGDLVVPELEAHQSVEMLETDDLLDGLQVVVFQIDLLQTEVDVHVRISEQSLFEHENTCGKMPSIKKSTAFIQRSKFKTLNNLGLHAFTLQMIASFKITAKKAQILPNFMMPNSTIQIKLSIMYGKYIMAQA